MKRQIRIGLFAGIVAVVVLHYVQRTAWWAGPTRVAYTHRWGNVPVEPVGATTRPTTRSDRKDARVYDVNEHLLMAAMYYQHWIANSPVQRGNTAAATIANSIRMGSLPRIAAAPNAPTRLVGPTDEEIGRDFLATLLSLPGTSRSMGFDPGLRLWAGRLIAMQTPEEHDLLKAYLDALRKTDVEQWK